MDNPLYGGLDLHSSNTMTSLLDADLKVVFERRLPNSLPAILGALAPYETRIAGLAVESTYNWYWLVDGLMEAGYRIHLANPAANQQYSGLKYNDDRGSARWLARLARLGILKEGYIYPREERPLRDLLRQRSRLSRMRVGCMLNVKAMFRNQMGRELDYDELHPISEARLRQLCPNGRVADVVSAQAPIIEALDRRIGWIEKRVLSQARSRPCYGRLQTVWGIGTVLGLTVMLETGPIGRFATVGDYRSYSRCVPSGHWSNHKRIGQGNVKNGNAYLAWAFVEAAIFAARRHEEASRYMQRKGHRMVGVKSLANKLCGAGYYVMRDGVEFDAKRLFAPSSPGRGNPAQALAKPKP